MSGRPIALSPQQLADAFGPRSSHSRRAISLLHAACGETLPPPAPLPLKALGAYYALIVQLVAAQFQSHLRGEPLPAERLAGSRPNDIPAQIQALFSSAISDDSPATLWQDLAWTDELCGSVREMAAQLARLDVGSLMGDAAPAGDLFKPLYQELFIRPVRHASGEYYTPDWLAESVLDAAEYRGTSGGRLLDPACGSGTFLITAIRRALQAGSHGPELCHAILDGVVGFDVNPLAVLSARANFLIALGRQARHVLDRLMPVHRRDTILDPPSASDEQRFRYVVGNPPWICWDDLPPAQRQATRPLWEQYGLFSLSGVQARHGGGKKDLSILMLYVCADRHLEDGGRLAMIVPQTLFQTRGAGDGFRRFRLGQTGPELRVLRVDDLADVQPFAAANWTAAVVLEKGRPTTYPVPYAQWSRDASPYVRRSSLTEPASQAGKPDVPCPPLPSPALSATWYDAAPIDPGKPTSPWFLRPRGLSVPTARLVGPSDYHAHLGANSGGANAVYWVRAVGRNEQGIVIRNDVVPGKRSFEIVETAIEPDLLYPLVRWGDVARFRAVPSAYVLLAQDPVTRRGIELAVMKQQYPRTLAYLSRFADGLCERAAYRRYQERGEFYSMYDVGQYTVAPVKVVWRRMDRRINAAVVEAVDDPLLGCKPVVPQETCVLVACECPDEAYYLCGLLNSAVVEFLAVSHNVRGGKSFGSPGMLDVLRLRRFDPGDGRHRELAGLAREAQGPRYAASEVQDTIDRLAGRLWGLDDEEASRCRIP